MNRCKGFTLIEVLIALAIIAIALTAIIKSTSQNIKDTIYLQDKMIAHWVALRALNEAELGLTSAPNENNAPHKTTMLDQSWLYKISIDRSANTHIKKIQVDVYRNEVTTTPLSSLVGYQYDE